MEDALGAADQVNLPGSDAGHPNWRRKLPLDIERWADSARVQDLFGMLRAERGG
jgi:4-alpha-glucanotransferase